MKRYLGIKTKVLPAIHKEISILLNGKRGSVCDIFSGSLAVSLSMKERGHSVISNDINLLSYIYGKAFLLAKDVPQFNAKKLMKGYEKKMSDIIAKADAMISSQRRIFERRNVYNEFHSWEDYRKQHLSLACVLSFLEDFAQPLEKKRGGRNDLFDYYTKAGKKSRYESVRGTKGNRNYFTAENASRVDIILSYIRYWFRTDQINEKQKCVLLSLLLDSVERHINIHGTYHDFPRNSFEARALKPFRFVFPDYFGLLHAGSRRHVLGKAQDSLQFIKNAPKHDILYLDPPYNFRQYTAYYFLPNFIASYADIKDLDAYLAEVQFVRGQNMKDDFYSTFCNKKSFIQELEKIIKAARCKHLILSYFNGVNHWNRFLEEDNTLGLSMIKDFLSSCEQLDKKSIKIVPVDRQNYQSQNGHRSKLIQEYLLVASKR